MKKSIIAIVAVSFLLISCGGSRWSCKKRYCKADVKTEMFKAEMFKAEKTALAQP